jgi:hypothetical protein
MRDNINITTGKEVLEFDNGNKDIKERLHVTFKK